MIFKFDNAVGFDYIVQKPFLTFMGGSLTFGLDGMALLLILLTNFVVAMVNISSWNKNYSASFYGLVLLMQFALIGVFSALNGILFYIFWEIALIPIFAICGIWGEGEDRMKTFVRFFIMTFVGSLAILAAFIILKNGGNAMNFDFQVLAQTQLSGKECLVFSILMLFGLGVKIPIFPLHAWQADTYQKAPAERTMLLSGIMLKMGIFGLIRWFIPFYDVKNIQFTLVVIILCVIGILYGAIIALRRNDLKLIAAFSSLSHVGLITAGLLAVSKSGIQGASIQMFVHGINVVGIFYIIDIIQKQTNTRNLSDLGGLASKAPIFSILSFIVILGTIATPLTNGFPGELLLLQSLFFYNKVIAAIAGISMILGAAYMLRVFQLSFFRTTTVYTESFKEIQGFDLTAMSLISLLVIVLGFFPQLILKVTESSAFNLINYYFLKLL